MPNFFKRILSFPIFKFKINYSRLNPRNITWFGFKKYLNGVSSLIVLFGAIIVIISSFTPDYSDTDTSVAGTADDSSQNAENCNTTGIELHGTIDTYIAQDCSNEDATEVIDATASEEVVGAINLAEKDEKIKAIILEVDSYGGYPVAAEEIVEAMKRATKPTVAMIRKAGVSAAYWSATGADIIFASASSDVGGIGVTNSYLDNSKKNTKDGLTFNSLATGIFKDAGNTDKPLTEAERKLIMRDAYIINDNFMKTIATNRNLDINKVKAMSDGSSMLGEAALQNGLIDRIGGIAEVKDYLKDKIGEEVEICW